MSCLIITNPRICEFYEKNPQLQIENVNLMIIELLNKCLLMGTDSASYFLSIMKENMNQMEIKTTNMIQEIQQPICSFISETEERIQSNISQLKMKPELSHSSTALLGNILNKLYTTSDIVPIVKKTSDSELCNTVCLKRQGCPKVLIHEINIPSNVNNDEIRQFVKTMEENNCSGIFLSQNSGFSCKSNYHIEIHNRLVMIFVHNVEYNSDKIKVAVDIVDHFSARIRELSYFNNNMEIVIEKEVLEEINKEYQLFIHHKENMITLIKDNYRKMMSQIEEFSFHSLDKYLSTKFSTTVARQGHKCELCKNFNAHNLKALAAHKRGCIRKNAPIISSIVQNTAVL